MDAVARAADDEPARAFDLYLEAEGEGLPAARQAAEQLRDRGVRTGVGPQSPPDHARRVGRLDSDGKVAIAGQKYSLDEVPV